MYIHKSHILKKKKKEGKNKTQAALNHSRKPSPIGFSSHQVEITHSPCHFMVLAS